MDADGLIEADDELDGLRDADGLVDADVELDGLPVTDKVNDPVDVNE